jgi:hypothetical protein
MAEKHDSCWLATQHGDVRYLRETLIHHVGKTLFPSQNAAAMSEFPDARRIPRNTANLKMMQIKQRNIGRLWRAAVYCRP